MNLKNTPERRYTIMHLVINTHLREDAIYFSVNATISSMQQCIKVIAVIKQRSMPRDYVITKML